MMLMEKKTEERLRRKLLALPLHHIDTNILLEPGNTENGKFCQKYLQKVGYNFRSKVSLPVLGELILKIINLNSATERYVALDAISGWIFNQKIDFYVPRNIGEGTSKVKILDSRVKETDAQIYACSVEDNAITLVTLDEDLVSNKKLENEFGVRILHPKELV